MIFVFTLVAVFTQVEKTDTHEILTFKFNLTLKVKFNDLTIQMFCTSGFGDPSLNGWWVIARKTCD